MQNETPEQRRGAPIRIVAVLALAGLAAVVLAACGSSSPSTTASSATNSASTKQSGSRANRFASLQACLKKEGINLPARPSGSGGQPPSGGPPGAGGGGRFKLPEGVSREKFQEALKKCGGGNFAGGRRAAFNSAAGKAALTKFAACMRENGINVPAPNTSGKGPVFDTKGLDTSSAAFKKAQQKCSGDVKGPYGGGRAGGAPPGGAPAAGAPEGGPPGEGAPGA
jgi:hypothetical protein